MGCFSFGRGRQLRARATSVADRGRAAAGRTTTTEAAAGYIGPAGASWDGAAAARRSGEALATVELAAGGRAEAGVGTGGAGAGRGPAHIAACLLARRRNQRREPTECRAEGLSCTRSAARPGCSCSPAPGSIGAIDRTGLIEPSRNASAGRTKGPAPAPASPSNSCSPRPRVPAAAEPRHLVGCHFCTREDSPTSDEPAVPVAL